MIKKQLNTKGTLMFKAFPPELGEDKHRQCIMLCLFSWILNTWGIQVFY